MPRLGRDIYVWPLIYNRDIGNQELLLPFLHGDSRGFMAHIGISDLHLNKAITAVPGTDL